MGEKDRKRDRNSIEKEESQKRSLKADRAKDRGARGQWGHFVSGLEFYMGPQRALRKRRRKKERKKFAPGPLSLSAALKAGDKTQSRMRKVDIDDKNIVRQVTFILVSSFHSF